MKITICGWAGTGTTSVSRKLKEILKEKYGKDYFLFSGGNSFRCLARIKKSGAGSHNVFEKLCINSNKYDFALDSTIAGLGEEFENIIIESRLAPYLVFNSFKVKLVCHDPVRFERIAQREGISFEKAKRQTLEREKSALERYMKFYGIKNLVPNMMMDLVINTGLKNIEESAGEIIKKM